MAKRSTAERSAGDSPAPTFQNSRLFREMTVAANVRVAAANGALRWLAAGRASEPEKSQGR